MAQRGRAAVSPVRRESEGRKQRRPRARAQSSIRAMMSDLAMQNAETSVSDSPIDPRKDSATPYAPMLPEGSETPAVDLARKNKRGDSLSLPYLERLMASKDDAKSNLKVNGKPVNG